MKEEIETDDNLCNNPKKYAPLGRVERLVSFFGRITTTYRRQRLYWRVWKATDIILAERHAGGTNKEFHTELNNCLDALEWASTVIKDKAESETVTSI